MVDRLLEGLLALVRQKWFIHPSMTHSQDNGPTQGHGARKDPHHNHTCADNTQGVMRPQWESQV